MKLRAALVEDHAVLRESLAAQITAYGIEVVGTAEDYASGYKLLVDGPQVHVALIDWKMPGGSGLRLAQMALAHSPALRVFMLTGFPNESLVQHAFDAGTCGVIDKSVSTSELFAMIERAFKGVGWQLDKHTSRFRKGTDADNLERRILRGLALGWTISRIAREIHLSPATAKSLATHVRKTHRLTNPFRIVDVARRLGALSDRDAMHLVS